MTAEDDEHPLQKYQQESPFKPGYTGTWHDPKEVEGGLTRDEPTQAELELEEVAPGQAAANEFGVQYHADYETLDDGMCRHARMHARALSQALDADKAAVALQSISHSVRHGDQTLGWAGDDMLANTVFEEIGQLRRNTVSTYLAVVHHAVVRSAQQLENLTLPGNARLDVATAKSVLRRSIVYLPWERDGVDPAMAEHMKLLGRVWVSCDANKRTFVAAGVPEERIDVIPVAHDPSSLVCRLGSETPVRCGKHFLHVGKWEPRKDQYYLIGAFLRAYGPSDNATLTLKTSPWGTWDDYPAPPETFRLWLADGDVKAKGWTRENIDSRVRLEDRLFTDKQMALLHAHSNIYVSPSHGEAWDMPCFDSTCIGNTIVCVGFGGPEMYTRHGKGWVIRVPYTMGPVHPGYGWEDEARWAHYEFEDLCQALHRAAPVGPRGYHPELSEFAMETVGKKMKQSVRAVVAEAGGLAERLD